MRYEITMAGNDAPSSSFKLSPDEVEAAISSFQSILRIPTVSSTAPSSGAYVQCAQYILSQLQSIPCLANNNNSFLLEESKDTNYPIVVAKWEGLHTDWPVIILNSHYDVVPAILDDWTVDPFSAERRDGKVSIVSFAPRMNAPHPFCVIVVHRDQSALDCIVVNCGSVSDHFPIIC